MTAQIHAYGVVIAFEEAPGSVALGLLKRFGFVWHPEGHYWLRARPDGAQGAIQAIRQAVDTRKPDGKCLLCLAPAGFERQTPAAPVLCDPCNTDHPVKYP